MASGPATARRMRGSASPAGPTSRRGARQQLIAAFGRLGRHFSGWPKPTTTGRSRPIGPRRSLSVETTFDTDLAGPAELAAALAPLAEELALRLARSGFQGRTLTVKLRYADFRLVTRQATRGARFRETGEIVEVATTLLAREALRGPARLLGVGVSSEQATADPRQLALL